MELDLTKRKTLLALVTPSMMHGAIESSFLGERCRNLWRIDKLNGRQYLLLLSENTPNLANVREQFGVDEADWITKDYGQLLDRAKNGTKWQFRLCANPTYSVAEKGQKRGKVHAHKTPQYQREWLMKQGEKNGFSVDEMLFDVTSSKWYSFSKQKNGKRVHMLAVTYEGILEVTDEKLFCDMLVHGLGREKAYGVGLMTIVQAKE